MDYRKYSKTGQEISALGLGLMRLPVIDGKDDAIDYELAKKMVDTCYKAGVNYFDTAYGYHGRQSQRFAAKALTEYPRDSYNLATKLPMWMVESREEAEKIFESQLEECGVEYFDFYLFHALNKDNFAKVINFGLWEMMDEKRKEGKIRNLGFSFHDKAAVLDEICTKYKWDFAQIQLNYLDYRQTDAKEQYEVLLKHDIPCIVMEPVRGGRLADIEEESNSILKNTTADKSIASWALRWVAGLPNILTVLSGMSNLEQVEDNISTFSPLEPLNENEEKALDKAVEIFMRRKLVPCTQCRYCMPCPGGLDIPALFMFYNGVAFDNSNFMWKNRYGKLEGKNAGDCIACGNCEKLCPQQIEIIEEMKNIHSLATAE